MTLPPSAHKYWREDKELQRPFPPFGPRNTYSNLAYLIAGWTVAGLVGDWILSAFLTFLGLGSWYYHAIKTRHSAALDFAGMFGVFGYLATLNWIVGVVAAVAGYILVAAKVKFPTQAVIFVGLVATFVRVGVSATGMNTFAWSSLAMFAVAFLVWNSDRGELRILGIRIASLPSVLGLYGHAVWHLITASAFVVLSLA